MADLTPRARAHGGRALRHFRDGQLDEAVAEFRRAIDAAPGDPHLQYNLATVLHAQGEPADALAVLEDALTANPDEAKLHFGRACVLQAVGRLGEAVGAFRDAVALQPDYVDAWYGLGTAQQSQAEYADASASYQRVVALRPDHPAARHMLDALAGEASDNPPPGFVRGLFDRYAPSYDVHLTGTLKYRAPELVASALQTTIGSRQGLEVLDLGCGTGLSGAVLGPFAARLTGVDLSPSMLEIARSRGCYDELKCVDLIEFLDAAAPSSFDLIIAVDVLNYLGSLGPVFEGVARLLRAGGTLAYTAELCEGDGYGLATTGRYQHSLAYLNNLRERLSLRELATSHEVIRVEDGAPCDGLIAVWGV